MKVCDDKLYEILGSINENWDEWIQIILRKQHRVPHELLGILLSNIVESIRIRETFSENQVGIVKQIEDLVLGCESILKKPAFQDEELLVLCSILNMSEASQNLKERLFYSLKKFKFRSEAYRVLLNQTEAMSKSKNLYLKYFERVLLDVTEESILGLMDNWYKLSEGLVWHGTHRENNSFAFKGYWCIEAVSLYKMLGSQSDKIESHKYFPKGMLNFN